MVREIVKVQIPVYASSGNMDQVLIYNESQDFELMKEISQAIKKVMKGSPKKFFLIEHDPEDFSSGLKFINEVEDPGW